MSIDTPVATTTLLPGITASANHGLAVAVLRLPHPAAGGRLAARTTVGLLQAAPGHVGSRMFRDQPRLRWPEQPVTLGAIHAIQCAIMDHSDSSAQIGTVLDQVSLQTVNLRMPWRKYAECRRSQPWSNIINSRVHICRSSPWTYLRTYQIAAPADVCRAPDNRP